MTALFHAFMHLSRMRWLGAAFCALAMLCVTTHASALAGATAHPRVDDNTTINASADNTTTASASEVAQTKTRVWGFEQNSPLLLYSLRSASTETHLRISSTQRETVSASSYAAEGGGSGLKALGSRINLAGLMDNCVSCAVALDRTLGGAPTSAIDSGILTTREVAGTYGRFGFSNYPSAASIEQGLLRAGPGARGIVFGGNGAGEVGHFFNAVNQGAP